MQETESIRLACSRHADNDYLTYISFRLADWVNTQRKAFKKNLLEGKATFITGDRIDSLNDIGFIWDPMQDAFDRRLSQLVEYKESYGDCNVPYAFKENLE